MIKVIVENCGALIERGSGYGNTFINIFLCLKNVLCELIDLIKEVLIIV